MTPFWSWFIIVVTGASTIGYLWILVANSRADVTEKEDHVWDEDLREFNNPLPRWWLYLFWITAFWLVAYLIIYPGMGGFKGTSGWTQVAQYEQEVATAEERYGNIFAAFADVPLEDLVNQPEAVKLGQNLFLNNCTTCHGSDARGAVSFPNLTDASWLYGSSAAAIQQTIVNGRIGVMPPQVAILGADGIENMVGYVLTLAGREPQAGADVEAGRQKYMQVCIACHGPTGTGNPVLGAPDLTADLWVHGGSAADIRDVLTNGRVNQMPAQRDLLTEDRIRTLVAYVMSLGS